MNKPALATVIATAFSALAFAAPPDKSAGSAAQGYLKNVARQHCSTTLSLFDSAAQRYVDTEAAAAWLDDDVATGWPALKGKQHYLVRLAEPQMITNFELSTKIPSGTISIYTGDADAAPGDKSWTQVAKDVPVESINNHRLSHRINKFAKYVLIETNIADSSPIYSINIYGERQASAMSIVKRSEPMNTKQVLGDFVNHQTAFNMAAIYAKGAVTFANSGGSAASWQRAIDDDPETHLNVKPSTSESGLVVRFDGAQPFTRLSLLTNPKTHGKVDVFFLSEAPQNSTAVLLDGVAPSVTLSLDGSTQRPFADFAEIKATAVALRWTPETGDSPLALRELNVFADLSLADHEVAGAPAKIAEGPGDKSEKTDTAEKSERPSYASRSSADGKSIADGKAPIAMGPGKGIDFKGTSVPPVAAGPGGFTPGSLGFPPILGIPRRPPNPTPTPVPASP